MTRPTQALAVSGALFVLATLAWPGEKGGDDQQDRVLQPRDALSSAGDLDPSFDGDGLVATDFPTFALEHASALVLQPDGKLVAAGSVGFVGSNSLFGLARYNADGSLDPTFDADGLVLTGFPVSATAHARALVLQPDGKLVAAGGVGYIPAGFALARYNSDGSLDSAFGVDGRVVTGFPPPPFGPTFSPARALVLQADGKLVAAGNTTAAGDCRFVLARYNPDGSLDATFDGDGIAIANSFVSCQTNALILQPDGKLVAAGAFSNNSSGSELVFGLVRFNSDGTLDPTFDGDGLASSNFFVSFTEVANALLLQADGKLVAAGGSAASLDGFFLARYNPDGSADASFDEDGLVVTGPPSFPARATALVRQPDGKLVATGVVLLGDGRFALARYNLDGSVDATFDGDGLIDTDFPSSAQEYASALVFQPDGKLVAAGGGTFGFDGGFGGFALARYLGLQVTPCSGKFPTLIGTEGDDVLVGTPDNDVIVGLGGNDIVNGSGGNDVICGGTGNDTLSGGEGDDKLGGDRGDDILLGGRGQDELLGGSGNDTLMGNAGDDTLYGQAGDDALDGGNSTDTCKGARGMDTATSCEIVTGVP